MRHNDPSDAYELPAEDDPTDENLGLGLVEEVSGQERTGTAPWKKWTVLGVVLAVVVVGAISLFSWLSPRDLAAEVAGAPDRAEAAVEVADGGTLKVVVAASVDAGIVEYADAPVPPAGMNYQMWLVAAGSGEPTSLAVMPRTVTTMAEEFKGLAGIESVMVTLEPEGGSNLPTSQELAGIALPQE